MKKILITTIMLSMVLTITSCGVSKETTEATTEVTTEETTEVTTEATTEATTEETTEATTEATTDITEETSVDQNLESIIEETYATTGLEFPRLVTTPLTKENQSYMLGVENFDFITGVVSEPLMTSQAHSVVLFTVEKDADIEGIKADIKANVDGRKWICVGVEPENIIVDNVDNMIILIMDEQSQAIHDAFLSVVK